MAKHMVLTYLHLLDPAIPIDFGLAESSLGYDYSTTHELRITIIHYLWLKHMIKLW